MTPSHSPTPDSPVSSTSTAGGSGWTAETLFAGDDDTARAHRNADWSNTSVGPVESWPSEMASAVATVFSSDIAMLLWLGPDLVQVFNDSYRPFLGVKYPAAVGQPAAQCWPDVWDDMGPLAEQALSGRSTKGTDVRLLMDRRGGLLEETYWTFSYSPIRRAHGGIAGVFVATSEVTGIVLARRRMSAVQQLGSISATSGEHPVAACQAATAMLASLDADFPLVMSYLDPVATFDASRKHRLGSGDNVVALADGRSVELVAVGGAVAPDEAHLWLADGPGIKAVASVAQVGVVEHLSGLSGDGNGHGPQIADVPLDDVVVLPLRIAGNSKPVGVLVVGTSPFQTVDDEHRAFLEVVAGRVSTTLTDVLTFEYERYRSEALAEIDASKTRFLENVSHEFRTPLTLLLAPLRGLMETAEGADRETLDIAHRNALRLRELVDSLLEVARASSGGVEVHRESTDVVGLTRGCIAQFDGIARSSGVPIEVAYDAPDRAGVLLDREKWAHIVTNLVGNAIKYTHEGSIRVSLSVRESEIVLAVCDTGIGIGEADLPHVFDRFYRVGDAHGRSAEGSGIGLALVSDMTDALGGTVSVDSTVGEGSTFTVVVPVETAVSASTSEMRASTRTPNPLVRHSVREKEVTYHRGVGGGGARSILLVEDNPDMSDYLVGLLTAVDWDVYAAGDAESALAHARSTRPGLVLTDVMLPGRSGLELVLELRNDPSLVRLPVVLLTARAGTSSAVEGLEAGADDYVVKPFEPRELIARLRVHLELSAMREELLAASDNEAATLQEALHTRSTIGTAIGLLMAEGRCNVDTAFQRLRTLSQHSNRKARDVAEELVNDFAR